MLKPILTPLLRPPFFITIMEVLSVSFDVLPYGKDGVSVFLHACDSIGEAVLVSSLEF